MDNRIKKLKETLSSFQNIDEGLGEILKLQINKLGGLIEDTSEKNDIKEDSLQTQKRDYKRNIIMRELLPEKLGFKKGNREVEEGEGGETNPQSIIYTYNSENKIITQADFVDLLLVECKDDSPNLKLLLEYFNLDQIKKIKEFVKNGKTEYDSLISDVLNMDDDNDDNLTLEKLKEFVLRESVSLNKLKGRTGGGGDSSDKYAKMTKYELKNVLKKIKKEKQKQNELLQRKTQTSEKSSGSTITSPKKKEKERLVDLDFFFSTDIDELNKKIKNAKSVRELNFYSKKINDALLGLNKDNFAQDIQTYKTYYRDGLKQIGVSHEKSDADICIVYFCIFRKHAEEF